ncbi:uncharacterized protein F5147DRAFT_770482 [Suillus discolor]|uniref:Uncharacterized protein n=1 Tax=Suillus discolor TaxID=1912936 RepID=A0A9P7FDN5_9AGAM|nr:uncharacterized protein F5147DRAFT_770482 [Suillus discolor]KAG2113837.1 hypothetical protein F5147DRAFT_770482 [Suillus discolor]
MSPRPFVKNLTFQSNDLGQAQNHTGSVEDIAVDFVNKGDIMSTPVFYLSDIGDSSRVTAKFTPVLRVYITSDYEETDIVQDQVDTPAMWTQDLTTLAQSTTLNLARDPNTGRYSIDHA